MTIAQKTVFITEDGKEFDSEIAAEAHSILLNRAAEIDNFLNDMAIPCSLPNGRLNPRRSNARNLIARWMAYQS